MANCFENVPHENIDNCPNQEISAGISTRLFYTPADNVTMTIPSSGSATALEDVVKLGADAITFKEGKAWKFIDVQMDEGELKAPLVGNIGNKKSKTELEAFIPGVKAKNLGFLSLYKNIPMIFGVIDTNNNKWVVGTTVNAAYIDTGDTTTGKKFEDNAGTTLKVVANTKLMNYEGDFAA